MVAFESPGEKMAANRLHLPSPVSGFRLAVVFRLLTSWQPSTQHVTHVYHTADPIPMGTCNGILSACAIAGFAMESRSVPISQHFRLILITGWL